MRDIQELRELATETVTYARQLQYAAQAINEVLDEVERLRAQLGRSDTITISPQPCDDCRQVSKDLIMKSDHHGGMKRVCRNRDACNRRSPG